MRPAGGLGLGPGDGPRAFAYFPCLKERFIVSDSLWLFPGLGDTVGLRVPFVLLKLLRKEGFFVFCYSGMFFFHFFVIRTDWEVVGW